MSDTGSSWNYRYASTMGERYALPVYFQALEDAQKHKQRCDQYLGGLTGQDSMRVEEWRGDEWVDGLLINEGASDG